MDRKITILAIIIIILTIFSYVMISKVLPSEEKEYTRSRLSILMEKYTDQIDFNKVNSILYDHMNYEYLISSEELKGSTKIIMDKNSTYPNGFMIPYSKKDLSIILKINRNDELKILLNNYNKELQDYREYFKVTTINGTKNNGSYEVITKDEYPSVVLYSYSKEGLHNSIMREKQ